MNNFKAMVILMVLAVLTSCKDQITTPQDQAAEKIIFTAVDNSLRDIPPHVVALDSAGGNREDWGMGSVLDAGVDRILWATGTDEDNAVLYTSNKVGGDRKNLTAILTTRESIFGYPAISPDGSKIAYATWDSDDVHKTHLYVINADGTNKVELSKTYAYETRFCFSPDSKNIAYFSKATDDMTHAVEIVSVNGSSEYSLTPVSYPSHDGNSSISWSTQNLLSYDDSGFVYIINADGSGRTNIAEGYTPQWSPDAATLAFSTGDDIMITSDKGVSITKLTNSTGIHQAFPKWSPDSKRMLVTRWIGNFDQTLLTLTEITVSTKESKVIASPGAFGFYVK